jgi:hypothetical protein
MSIQSKQRWTCKWGGARKYWLHGAQPGSRRPCSSLHFNSTDPETSIIIRTSNIDIFQNSLIFSTWLSHDFFSTALSLSKNYTIVCSSFIGRDEKRNLRFPCIQWKRKRNFVPVSTVYKGNANFVSRPCLLVIKFMLEVSKLHHLFFKPLWNLLRYRNWSFLN